MSAHSTLLRTGLALTAAVGFTILYILYPQYTHPLRKRLPSPPRGHWLVGHLIGYKREVLQGWLETYGNRLFICLGRWPTLVTTDVSLVKEICITQFKNFTDRASSFQPNRHITHLLWARGQRWRFIRAAISPAFAPSNLQLFCGQMNTSAERLVAKLKPVASEGTMFDLQQCLGETTMEVIAGTAFGVDLNQNSASQFTRAAADLFSVSGAGNTLSSLLRLIVPPIAYLYNDLPPLRARARYFRGIVRLINDFGREQIVKRRHNPDLKSLPGFLQMLLNARDPETGRELTDFEVIEQCRLFMLAGYDTTASTLTYTIYLLAQHPDIEARMVEEILSHDTSDLDLKSLQPFKYVEAVLNESLRLYPPGNSIIREAVADTTVDGLPMPKGTTVIVPLYSLHRDVSLFPEPDRFAPERFLDGDSPLAAKDKAAFGPFGHGPRMCVGYRFAMAEALIALIHLYKYYSFELSPDTPSPLPLRSGITLSPGCLIHVRALLRE
eukprot:m.154863 g.154863  ORF g.154863 m.154863 type:complete len:497 (-) comp15138_c10_seq3:34-1524(-)